MITPLLANTITPAIFSATAYLLVLNALIGLIEGKLLRGWFGAGRRAVWWMILANYLSAWAGWMGMAWIAGPRMEVMLGDRPIERVNLVAGLMFVATFIVSVIVEWGIVYLALGHERRWIGRAMKGSLAVNGVTYPLIGLWFLSVSYTLPLNARISSEAELGPMPRGTLYWVDPEGRVMARALDGTGSAPREVGRVVINDFVRPCQLRLKAEGDRIALEPQYSTATYRDHPTPPGLEPPEGDVVANAGFVAGSGLPADYWDQSVVLRKSVLDLRPVEQRQTRIGFDAYRQCLTTRAMGGRSSRLIVGWAIMDWEMSEPTVLADDKVVFEWGGQIVIFDPRTGRMAFVARGSCPAVVAGERGSGQ